MITCLLNHGLGNRLYQIVRTLNIARKYNINYYFSDEIVYNIEHKTNLHYKNNIFSKLNFEYLYDELNYKIYEYRENDIILSLNDYYNLMNNYTNTIKNDKNYILNYELNDRNYYMIDYKDIDRFYLNDLLVNKKILNEIKEKYKLKLINSLCIHVRRGDFVNIHINRIRSSIFYYESIKEIEKYRRIDNILIISDDIKWCKEYLKDSRCVYVDEVDYIQFYLGTLCNNFIVSNSTFAFWFIVLNLNNNNIIITDDKSWHFNNIEYFDNIEKYIKIKAK